MKWNMAPKLFQKRESWSLEKAKMEENLEELGNPSVGWYQIFTFPLDQPWDSDAIRSSLKDSEQLVFLLVDIGAFRTRELDTDALNNLRSILAFFRDCKKEIILRMTYDTVGKGMEHEPTRFDQVQRHVLQLTGVLCAFTAHIYIIQGVLVGSWGEMHNSRHLAQNRIACILDMLDTQLDSQVYLSVRKPSYYRMVRTEEQWQGRPECRIGLFNDGIFGSSTDLGTYGLQLRENTDWDQPWSTEDELKFQEKLSCTVPNGGEVIRPAGEPLSLQQTVERLKTMHISYLNSRYDLGLLESWGREIWESKDSWHGMNGRDYIGRHLGYRFRIQDAFVRIDRWSGKMTVSVLMDNAGFSACYFPTELNLCQKLSNGEIRTYSQSVSACALGSGEAKAFQFAVEPMESSLYLKMTRTSDGRNIQFGTTGEITEDGLLLGTLVKGK